eukprot:366262-Chlamydomonas_euryale.AAC.2
MGYLDPATPPPPALPAECSAAGRHNTHLGIKVVVLVLVFVVVVAAVAAVAFAKRMLALERASAAAAAPACLHRLRLQCSTGPYAGEDRAPCVWTGPHACGQGPMRADRAPCVWTGPHACGRGPMRADRAPCVRTGPHACGQGPMRVDGTPCVWTGPHACGQGPMRADRAPCGRGLMRERTGPYACRLPACPVGPCRPPSPRLSPLPGCQVGPSPRLSSLPGCQVGPSPHLPPSPWLPGRPLSTSLPLSLAARSAPLRVSPPLPNCLCLCPPFLHPSLHPSSDSLRDKQHAHPTISSLGVDLSRLSPFPHLPPFLTPPHTHLQLAARQVCLHARQLRHVYRQLYHRQLAAATAAAAWPQVERELKGVASRRDLVAGDALVREAHRWTLDEVERRGQRVEPAGAGLMGGGHSRAACEGGGRQG